MEAPLATLSPSGPKFKTVTVKPWRFWMLTFGIYIGLFLSMMDTSIVASSLHTISVEFSVFISVNWVALAYTLAECSCAVVFARISDIIGRRNAWLGAMLLFFAFSLACGFAQNLDQLVAFRTLQGIGGAGLYSMTTVIMPDVCPHHLLEYAIGLGGVVIMVACVAGPIVGGILTQYATWRWIFWINGPICVVSVIFFLLFWPKAEDMLPVARRPWRSFDYIGSILLIAASVLTVFAFQNVGVSTSNIWDTAIFIAPLVTGLVSWLALLAWEYVVEYRTTRHIMPTFPLSLFRNRFYGSGAITTLFLGFPLYLLVFSVPPRAQLVSGKSALIGALMLLPMLGMSALACVIAAGVNAKRNYLFETQLTGAALSLLGCALLATISDLGDDSKLLGYLIFPGLGSGLSLCAATVLTGLEIPPSNYAPAQAIISQGRVLGGSFGIAVTSIFLHNEVIKLVGGPIPPQLAVLLGDAESKLPSHLQHLVRQACSEAFRNCMIVSAVISGAAVLLTLLGYQRTHGNTKQQRLDLIREDELKRWADEETSDSRRKSQE